MNEQLLLTILEEKEKCKPGRQFKQYEISDMNRQYFEAFQRARYPEYEKNIKQRNSLNQYRSTISNFLEAISKDVAMTKREDIDTFLSTIPNEVTKNNKAAHIKSFLIFIITDNVKNCTSKISRDLLIKLLEM